MNQELPFTRHIFRFIEQINIVQNLIVFVLVRPEEVVVSNPECHIVISALKAVVSTADTIGCFECPVESLNHLLERTEFL